jgi:uncharacterized protein (TIGR02246 family)
LADIAGQCRAIFSFFSPRELMMATIGPRMLALSLVYATVLWASEQVAPKQPDKQQAEKPAAAKTTDESAEKEKKAEAKETARRIEDEDAEKASPEEKAIRQVVRQIEEAYNKHDQQALTAMFSKHGEIVDAGGRVTQGPEEIAAIFRSIFEEHPETQMSVDIESIRVLGDAVAVEEGVTRVTHAPGEKEEIARYAVVYSKEGNDWKMISARDLPAESATDDHLEQLAWLVGDWLDESDDSVVTTSYRFSANQRYLIGTFHVETPEEGVLDGTVHVGWDPQMKQLRSWVFDSEGGFATGLWSHNDETWIVKLTGVLADGRTTTSTYRMRRLSSDHAEIDSRDRVIGDLLIEDSEPVTIVRRGPAPETVGDE